jgi:glycosyltransferase involved in cell wall biosynthesis
MTSVVVPIHNEAESLATLHAELSRAFEPIGPAEFVFIDDGSRDGSWKVIQGLARTDPRVRGIRFRRNFGKAAALTAGFQAARGAIVFTLDGDLQDDPARSLGSWPNSMTDLTWSAAGKRPGTTPGTRSALAGSSTRP